MFFIQIYVMSRQMEESKYINLISIFVITNWCRNLYSLLSKFSYKRIVLYIVEFKKKKENRSMSVEFVTSNIFCRSHGRWPRKGGKKWVRFRNREDPRELLSIHIPKKWWPWCGLNEDEAWRICPRISTAEFVLRLYLLTFGKEPNRGMGSTCRIVYC